VTFTNLDKCFWSKQNKSDEAHLDIRVVVADVKGFVDLSPLNSRVLKMRNVMNYALTTLLIPKRDN
jgi:hypothetical protein